MKPVAAYIVSLSLCATLLGCSSHAYYAEAMQYVEKITQTLIDAGLCADKVDCSKKEMTLASAGGWKVGPLSGGGVVIQVYRVSSQETAKKIVNQTKTLHSQIPSVPVTVTVYSNAHSDKIQSGTSIVVLREKFL